MTIDETGNPVENANVTSLVTLENPDMIRELFGRLANAFADASDLNKRVHALTQEMEKITNALIVANENAARAIAERDEAIKARDRAIELRDQADHAYQNVNEQRIATARGRQDTKETLRVNKALLDGYVSKEEEYRQEIEEWTKENASLKAEVFHATSGAASM